MDPARQALAAVAAAARDAYGRSEHMRVRSSGIVHDVVLTRWIAGETLPGPACMVGIAGWDPSAAHPDTGPVTCRRCLRLDTTTATPDVDQLALFPADHPDDDPRPSTISPERKERMRRVSAWHREWVAKWGFDVDDDVATSEALAEFHARAADIEAGRA